MNTEGTPATSSDIVPWITSTYGSIKAFQEKAGLNADGIAGPITRGEGCRVRNGGTAIPEQKYLRAVYGDFSYKEAKNGAITIDPEWAAQNIRRVKLFDGKARWMHDLIADEFAALYKAACSASGYTPHSVQTYVPRHTLWNPDKPLSTHSWGIAVDFDPQWNRMGGTDARTHGPSMLRKHPEFVQIFEAAGWEWGGNWRIKDDMHFQRARV